MAKEKQTALGDELFGTAMAAANERKDDAPDLAAIQADSESQELP